MVMCKYDGAIQANHVGDGMLIPLYLINIFQKNQFQPGSNRRPFACKANVITTTLWNLQIHGEKVNSIIKTTFYYQDLTWLKKTQFCPGSNRGPFACEANVITTTLQNCAISKKLIGWYPASTPHNTIHVEYTTHNCKRYFPKPFLKSHHFGLHHDLSNI